MSIDDFHTAKIAEFEENRIKIIPNLICRRQTIRELIKEGPQIDVRDLMMEYREIKTRIGDLRRSEKDYLLINSKFIHSYYHNIEAVEKDANKKIQLNSFFHLQPPTEIKNNDSIDYWNRNNAVKIQTYNASQCHVCHTEFVVDEGFNHCQKCHTMHPTQDLGSSGIYTSDQPAVLTGPSYLRLGHFNAVLSQFSGMKSNIPDGVMQSIKDRLKKQKGDVIDYSTIKAVLKTLKLNRYADHIVYIMSLLGVPPPLVSLEYRDKLTTLFLALQAPFARHCPSNRQNFFSYTFCLFKLCELVKGVQLVPFLPELKDKVKNRDQILLWNKCLDQIA